MLIPSLFTHELPVFENQEQVASYEPERWKEVAMLERMLEQNRTLYASIDDVPAALVRTVASETQARFASLAALESDTG